MITEDRTARERRLEKVYRANADNIYRICLYYLRDERKAAAVAEQAFLNYYKRYDVTNSKYTFGCLVNETKKLLISGQSESVEVEELRECTTSGKN